MEQIIAPVERELLKKELTPDRRLRRTNKRDNEIYVVTYQNAPNVVREIGRLREIALREAGGGTGKACDLDEFDTMDVPYRQLIVWDPQREEILGGYRYLPGPLFKLDDKGQPILATSHMFHFSQEFIDKYMRSTIELGRDMILYFLNKHFGDKDKLVTPMTPVTIDTDPEFLKKLFDKDSFKEDYKILHTEVRKLGFNIPPLVNAYMSLSPTMRMFGTAINDTFGNVEETGILIAVDEIFDEKRMRYINSFVEQEPGSLEILRDVLKAPGNKRN